MYIYICIYAYMRICVYVYVDAPWGKEFPDRAPGPCSPLYIRSIYINVCICMSGCASPGQSSLSLPKLNGVHSEDKGDR